MVANKSLDELYLISALTSDVFTSYGGVFTTRDLRLTLKKLEARYRKEGIGFLTKTLPRLGKAFDKALCEVSLLDCKALGFKPYRDTKLPKLFGELFSRVFQQDGTILPTPCVNSIKHIRQLLYLFYKYELPYSDEQEQHVLAKFRRTEHELETVSERLCHLGNTTSELITSSRYHGSRKVPRFQGNAEDPSDGKYTAHKSLEEVTREARRLLSNLFAFFDPKDIYPRHGPGVVATKQLPWAKYEWTNVSAKITRVYPLDEYFYTSLSHVCDRLNTLKCIKQDDLPAQVLLVPKDSRGPRLISAEPVDYQWVQQGLGRSLVRLVETHPLTRYCVFFTDQRPNQIGALLGSETGGYATLDLNEASDRVSLELVRLLFPPHIYVYLESCRSSSTVLPDGLVLPLWKFAPMGSSLCFPILALTIWAILTAALPDTHARESIHVYGDDVIVPTAYAADAIKQLESFGLLINRDKSCTKGFFRESCGMDAFKGVDVTPVRLRTVWAESPSPNVYPSWIAYANSFWDKRYYATYDYIVGHLHRIYGAIPAKDMSLSCPSLASVSDEHRPKRSRINRHLQKKEWMVRDIKSSSLDKELDGWSLLLRYFSEKGRPQRRDPWDSGFRPSFEGVEPLSVRSYTRRGTSMLVSRWR